MMCPKNTRNMPYALAVSSHSIRGVFNNPSNSTVLFSEQKETRLCIDLKNLPPRRSARALNGEDLNPPIAHGGQLRAIARAFKKALPTGTGTGSSAYASSFCCMAHNEPAASGRVLCRASPRRLGQIYSPRLHKIGILTSPPSIFMWHSSKVRNVILLD